MTLFSIYIFNRYGDTIYVKHWKRTRSAQEGEAGLIAGFIYTLQHISSQLASNGNGGLLAVQTPLYKLHYYETLTGYRVALLTDKDMNTSFMQGFFVELFRDVFTRTVTKNPAYTHAQGEVSLGASMLLVDGTGHALRLEGAAHDTATGCLIYAAVRYALPDDMPQPRAGAVVDEVTAADATPASLRVHDVTQLSANDLEELCDGTHALFMHEHRNIVHTYAAFVCSAASLAAAAGGASYRQDALPASGLLCVVQECMQQSCTLADYLGLLCTAQLPRPGAALVAAIAHDVLKAVAHLHDRGHSVHRHLTPAHLLLHGATGCVKLAAMEHTAVLECATQSCAVGGSVGYMAPEVLMYTMLTRSPGVTTSAPRLAHGMGCKADIWSLGIVLLELVTTTSCQDMDRFAPYMRAVQARRACDGATNDIMRSDERSLDDVDAAFGPALVDMIGQCLRVEPEARPGARELLHHPLFYTAVQHGAAHEDQGLAVQARLICEVVESVAALSSKTTSTTAAVHASHLRGSAQATAPHFVWSMPEPLRRVAFDKATCEAAPALHSRSHLDSHVKAATLEGQRAVLRLLRQLEAWRARVRQSGGGGGGVGRAANQMNATQIHERAAETALLARLDALASRLSRERVVRLFADLTRSIRALQTSDSHDDAAGQLCELLVTQVGRDEAAVTALLRHGPLAQLFGGGASMTSSAAPANHDEATQRSPHLVALSVYPASPSPPPPTLLPPPLLQDATTSFALEHYTPATAAAMPVAPEVGLTRRALERCLPPAPTPLPPPRKTPEAGGKRGGATVSPMDYLFAHGVQRLQKGRLGAQS